MGENTSVENKLEELEFRKIEEAELRREYEKLQEELVEKKAILADKDEEQELGE